MAEPSPDRRPSLSAPRAPLIGRERERADVGALLCRGDVALATLTGPGGVGKTRLAIEIASDVASDFPDGAWFVDLAPVADPDLVASTIAATLGLRPLASEPVIDRLEAALRDRRALLLLDNFEQVVDAALVVARLLDACPRLTILATSRVRLRLSHELEYIVAPLPVARSDDLIDREPAAAAVQLFVQRAQAVRADFALTAENAGAITAICVRLDGLPLAIELAAARVKLFPPAALLARLERRLPLLAAGDRDRPRRQQTMRDAIAWSYDLLPADAQRMFRRLAVFSGGFTLPAAEAVATESDADLVEALAMLVDASLVQPASGSSEPRYRMLETIREFGLERLEASGEAEAIRERHAARFIVFAVAAELWRPWPRMDIARRMDAVERDNDNLRSALGWFVDRGRGEQAQLLASVLPPLWTLRGHYREGYAWLERALTTPGGTAVTRRNVLGAAAGFALACGDRERALRLGTDLLEMADLILSPDDALAHAREWLGPDEDDLTQSAITVLANLIQGPHARKWAHQFLAVAVDDLDEAAAHFERALAVNRELDDRVLVSEFLGKLGVVTLLQGNPERATALVEEGLALARDPAIGDDWAVAIVLFDAALVAIGRGDDVRAVVAAREGLLLFQRLGSPTHPADFLFLLGAAALNDGQPMLAVRLWGAATARPSDSAIVQTPYIRDWFARFIAAAQATLGADAYAAAWQAGQALTLEAAIAEALAFEPSWVRRPATQSGAAARHGLTPREVEILRLLVDGRSNPEIADALFISRRTVTTHLTRIFAKLGVDRRDAAISVALRAGLVER